LLLLFIILGIVFKWYHLPFASIIISLGLVLFSLGIYIFGIRCLYLADKNSYLKYLSFLGCCFITIAMSGLMFKLQHWLGGSELATIANYSIIIGTTLVLLTLRSSGYLEWKDLHKKIFKQILFPWVFVFVLFIMSFLLPQTFRTIMGVPLENTKTVSFKMPDYSIENKNGLEPQ